MADVTAPRIGAPPTNGTGPETPAADLVPRATSSPDPRSVRVGLVPASAGIGDPILVVTPVPARGDQAGPTVRAQRHGLVEGDPEPATMLSLDAGRHRLLAGGVTSEVVVEAPASPARGVVVREVLVDGFRFEVQTESERLASLRERATRDRAGAGRAGPLDIHAIIPGRVVDVWVTPGDTVTAGERVLAIEAMKMQNELLAPRDGTIARVGVAVGETVEIGDLLVVID